MVMPRQMPRVSGGVGWGVGGQTEAHVALSSYFLPGASGPTCLHILAGSSHCHESLQWSWHTCCDGSPNGAGEHVNVLLSHLKGWVGGGGGGGGGFLHPASHSVLSGIPPRDCTHCETFPWLSHFQPGVQVSVWKDLSQLNVSCRSTH